MRAQPILQYWYCSADKEVYFWYPGDAEVEMKGRDGRVYQSVQTGSKQ